VKVLTELIQKTKRDGDLTQCRQSPAVIAETIFSVYLATSMEWLLFPNPQPLAAGKGNPHAPGIAYERDSTAVRCGREQMKKRIPIVAVAILIAVGAWCFLAARGRGPEP
jgi:hypothetical protein